MPTYESGFPSLDAAYRCVAHERRRLILDYLRESEDGLATLDDLVDYVASQENHRPVPDRETVTIDLYHLHLPLLDDKGVIEFDSRSETVRYSGHSAVKTVLDDALARDADRLPVDDR